MSTTIRLDQPCDMPDGCGAPAGQPCRPGCPSLANDLAHDSDADDEPEPAQVTEAGEVLLVDPRDLVIGANGVAVTFAENRADMA
jgi:hypothetical protein